MIYVDVYYTDEVVKRSLFLNPEDVGEIAYFEMFHEFRNASRFARKYLVAGYLVALYAKKE